MNLRHIIIKHDFNLNVIHQLNMIKKIENKFYLEATVFSIIFTFENLHKLWFLVSIILRLNFIL